MFNELMDDMDVAGCCSSSPSTAINHNELIIAVRWFLHQVETYLIYKPLVN
jgi:hypothetical protein